jgi:hypothetical protein
MPKAWVTAFLVPSPHHHTNYFVACRATTLPSSYLQIWSCSSRETNTEYLTIYFQIYIFIYCSMRCLSEPYEKLFKLNLSKTIRRENIKGNRLLILCWDVNRGWGKETCCNVNEKIWWHKLDWKSRDLVVWKKERREESFFCVLKMTSYVQLKGRGNANTKRTILEQDLPNIIKNITYKIIILCCKVRKW